MPDPASLRAEILSAPEVAKPAAKADKPAPAADAAKPAGAKGTRGNGKGGRRPRPRGHVWDGCPVVPLGVHGAFCYYLDRLGQLRAIETHGVEQIRQLFGGDVDLVGRHYPQFDKEGAPRPGKFDQQAAAAALTAAAYERGLWQPVGRVRGPGAWVDDDGNLIYHAGDAVLIDGAWQAPGVYHDRVYPAEDAIPRPADLKAKPPPAPGAAAAEALQLIGSWQFRRPDIDPVLALGGIGAQMMGGALDWRPVMWLTGDAATGKSTFQRLLLLIHGGENGLLQSADATEAGIRSVVRYASLPVAVDELEPDADKPQKVKAVIELARRAASGGQIFRGGADQKGHQSNAVSAFLFSSILVPPMPAQDRSRLILLDLDRLPDGAAPVALVPAHWRQVGARIKAALFQGWPRWRERLELWRGALARHGQNGRGADNYATVLAMADMALHPNEMPTPARLDEWASQLSHSATEEALEVGSNADDMLAHLLSQPLDIWRRGQRFTVAQWVQMAASLPGGPEQIETATAATANTYLAPYGLRVRGHGAQAALCIANKPLAGLAQLFEGSMWAGGVWAQAARRMPGAEAVPLTMSGVKTRGHAIPLATIPGLMALPADRRGPPQPPPTPYEMEDFA